MLFDWRAALISLVTIPLAIIAAGVVLLLAGVSLNAISVVGIMIAVAVVIDDVVGLVDGVLQRLRAPRPDDAERSRADVVIDAVVEGRRPVVYATLVIIVALVPLLFVTGVVGAFLPSIARAYAVAILASLVVSVTVAPALAVLVLSAAPGERRESPVLRRLRAAYRSGIAWFLARTRPAWVGAGVMAVTVAVVAGLAVAPANAEGVLAHVPPARPAGPLGRGTGHLAPRDDAHRVTSDRRAAVDPWRAQRRRPRRSRHHV